MATATDNDSGIETSGMLFGSSPSKNNESGKKTTGKSSESSTSKGTNVVEVLDYNVAFPQLVPAGKANAHTLPSSAFPLTSNGNNSAGAMANTTTSLYSASKDDEDRRRKMALYATSTVTKIVSFIPLISRY